MHDAVLVGIAERLGQAAQDLDDAALVAGVLAPGQVAVGQVGQGVVEMTAGRAADLVDADDVRVVQPRDQACLVLEALDQVFAGRAVGTEYLDGDFALQRGLDGQIYRRHAALTELARDAVTGNFKRNARIGGHRP